jgi:hypothetical protein
LQTGRIVLHGGAAELRDDPRIREAYLGGVAGAFNAQISRLATEKQGSERALTPRNESETSRMSSMGSLIALLRKQQARGGSSSKRGDDHC